MNKTLTNDVINKFDYKQIKKYIITFISSIDLLLYKLKRVESPKITCNYEIKYSFTIPVRTSKIEEFVINKICLEEELIEIISKYVNAINSLNKDEREVFIKSYLYDYKDDLICSEMGIFLQKLTQIKKSASIKFSNIIDLENLFNNN